MPIGIMTALAAIVTILDLVANGAAAVEKIKGVIAKAQAEGRDVTAEELQAIYDQTDTLERVVRNGLAAAARQAAAPGAGQ